MGPHYGSARRASYQCSMHSPRGQVRVGTARRFPACTGGRVTSRAGGLTSGAPSSSYKITMVFLSSFWHPALLRASSVVFVSACRSSRCRSNGVRAFGVACDCPVRSGGGTDQALDAILRDHPRWSPWCWWSRGGSPWRQGPWRLGNYIVHEWVQVCRQHCVKIKYPQHFLLGVVGCYRGNYLGANVCMILHLVHWYVPAVSIIFDCFMPIFYSFHILFATFYTIFGTNILIQCLVPVPVCCMFFLQNIHTKQSPNVIKTYGDFVWNIYDFSEEESTRGDARRAHKPCSRHQEVRWWLAGLWPLLKAVGALISPKET